MLAIGVPALEAAGIPVARARLHEGGPGLDPVGVVVDPGTHDEVDAVVARLEIEADAADEPRQVRESLDSSGYFSVRNRHQPTRRRRFKLERVDLCNLLDRVAPLGPPAEEPARE